MDVTLTPPTATPPPSASDVPEAVIECLRRYWGYDRLRPLQAEAIAAGMAGRDSLVVLPTGGGKSLCYQLPPLLAGRVDVVVSPLISLMKDQVDGLRASGYPAAALFSGQSEAERRDVFARANAGSLRLLFVAPERLLTPEFLDLAQRLDVRAFAIDEAHCISQWGHDFRPEYRRLAGLRQRFPNASLHAFTATATPRVREDIVRQLGLKDAAVLVGRFDRANLVYRVEPRTDLDTRLRQVVARHKDEAVIVYCLSRNDTERVAAMLQQHGVKAGAYHAGMSPPDRARTQDAFAAERLDVIVATVAFGMGIDRGNVRCVVHAAMPKSVEHYQQETGRAGRDGLEAECVLFYSAGDLRRWQSLMLKNAAESPEAQEVAKAQMQLLSDMQRFCESMTCRHASLTRYFGQEYETENCGACDVCLDGAAPAEDGSDTARTIAGCIAALGRPFGVGYVVEVLSGAQSERLQRLRHDKLAQYGVLKSLSRDAVKSMIMQLVDLGVLDRSSDERPVLTLGKGAHDVLSGRRDIALRLPKPAPVAPALRGDDWQGVDRGLFERLRVLRRSIADERNLPPFVIFGDATLRELARWRPTQPSGFGGIKGVGAQKLADLGEVFTREIRAYCQEQRLPCDLKPATAQAPLIKATTPTASAGKQKAYELFGQGVSISEVAQQLSRAPSTVASYLEDYVGERKPRTLDAWVPPRLYARIEAAARASGGSLLRPVFEALNGEVTYDEIRIVMRHAGLR